MDLTIRRQKCKASFDRSSVANYAGVPAEEISAVVDKVEIAADHFKYKKCFKKGLVVFFVLLFLCIAGCAFKAHLRHKWHRRQGQEHRNQPYQMHGGHMFGPRHLGRPQHNQQTMNGEPQGIFNQTNNSEAPHHSQKAHPCRGQRFWRHGQRFRHHNGRPRHHHRGPRHHDGRPRHHDERAERGDSREANPKTEVPTPTIQPKQTPQPAAPKPVLLPVAVPQVEDNKTVKPVETQEKVHFTPKFIKPAPSMDSAPLGANQSAPFEPTRLPNDRHHRRRHHRRHPREHRYQQDGRRFHHRKRRCCFKIIAFFVVFALALVLGHRCARKRIHRRIKAILEVENRMFRAKYGVEWKTNCKVTQLTLAPLHRPAVQMVSYPTQAQVAPHQQIFNTPFEEAPVIHEGIMRGHQQPHRDGPRGYQRVSLDDSAIGYSYR